MNQYARFYASYNTSVKCGNSASKEEVVFEFTGGRTTSLRELSEAELNDLIDQLNQIIQLGKLRARKSIQKMKQQETRCAGPLLPSFIVRVVTGYVLQKLGPKNRAQRSNM